MGRGSQERASTATVSPRRDAAPTRYEVLQPGTPPDIGSPAHLRRLQSYARGRLNRRDIYISLDPNCPTAFTDMEGNITITDQIPPQGSAEEKELCIRGLLRHELLHERLTSPEAYKAFKDDLRKIEETHMLRSRQLHGIWNMLEDGMIETRERWENPGSYEYISALNQIQPRVGADHDAEDHFEVPCPEGYIPRDANGNELQVSNGMVQIPAGTTLSPWGEHPLSKEQQMQAAILAESVPEFEPGQLHPDVQDAMDTIRPLIDNAVRGNTSDCIANAYAIEEELEKRDLLPPTPSNQEIVDQITDMIGGMQPTAPEEGDGQGQGGQGQGQGGIPVPINPMPEGGNMGDELRDKMENGQDGNQGPSQGQEGQGNQGQGNQGQGNQGQGNQGQGNQGQGNQGQGNQGQGDQGQGDQGQGNQGQGNQGQDSQGGPNNRDETRQGSPGQGGAASGHQAGVDASAPLPKEARDDRKSSKADVDKLLGQSRRDIDQDKATQQSNDNRAIRQGKIGGDQWQMPGGESCIGQKELTQQANQARRNSGHSPLEDETFELQRLGAQMEARLKRIKMESRADKRYKKRGRLDQRRLSSAMSGAENVFYRKGQDLDTDIEIDVSIDRSGSVTQQDTRNQYRMAKMFAFASKKSKIPTSIYGWSGGYGGCEHYAYKESHSDEMKGLDSIFISGGGGTPTGEAIEFSRARLKKSKAKKKIMVVITDGGANDLDGTRQQVNQAKRQGVEVIGMAFGDGCDPAMMDEQFGNSNWVPINDYTDAPRIIGGLIERRAKASVKR